MIHFLKIYKALMRINFRYLVEYRANLYNHALSSITWTIFSMISVYLLTQRTTFLFGMKREELWLLTTLYSVFIGMFHLVFSANFNRFAELIYLGQLDTLLTKPLDSQLLVSFWKINFATFIRFVVGVSMSIWVVVTFHIAITFSSVLLSFCLMFVSLALLYAFWLLVTTCIVFSPRLSNLVELLYSITGMARLPQRMYQISMGTFLTSLFPIALVLTVPVHAILRQLTLSEVASLALFTIILNGIARWFFLYALRSYTSVNA